MALVLGYCFSPVYVNLPSFSNQVRAGAGLPGLTAARLGATRVVLTDIRLLLPGLINNVVASGLEDRLEVRELEWGSDESDMSRLGELGEFGIVLMSDVFYDAEEMVGLGKTLKKLCGNGTMVWAVSEIRPWASECVNELISRGFGVIESPCQFGGKQDNNNNNSLESFTVHRLIPPIEENCHVA